MREPTEQGAVPGRDRDRDRDRGRSVGLPSCGTRVQLGPYKPPDIAT